MSSNIQDDSFTTMYVHGENSLQVISPIDNFQPLELGFEGIPSATEPAPVHYLVIQPVNYLTWDVRTRALQLYHN